MLNQRQYKILKKLLKETCVVGKELQTELNVSNKTMRIALQSLNDELKRHGACIISKHGQGYSLDIKNEEEFEEFYKNKTNYSLVDEDDRIRFLTQLFLMSRDYIKIADLCEILYVSQKTISKEIKMLEEKFHQFNIELQRKSHYGIKAIGKEEDIRKYLASTEWESNTFDVNYQISEILSQVLNENGVKMSEIATASLAMHLQIMLERTRKKHSVQINGNILDGYIFDEDLNVAKKTIKHLEDTFNIDFPEDEIYYIATHIASKKYHSTENTGNIVIDEEISHLLSDIFQYIYEAFNIDFRKDLDIHTMLAKHLIPLRARLKFGYTLKNPILDVVMKQYAFAYNIALGLNPIINSYFHNTIDENETSYIALAIALAIEKSKSERKEKKNVLLVCISGSVTSKLFEYRFGELFKESIDKVFVCDYSDLLQYDFTNIDYIFTNMDIDIKIPVPIYKIQHFFDDNEIKDIKVLFSAQSYHVMKYFPKELFLSNIKATNRSEVIRLMCNHISKYIAIGDDFYDLVIKREVMMHTEFGNKVAMPHPYKVVSNQTFVCVCILEQPIHWQNQEVQIIFLVSISKNYEDDVKTFYNILFELALVNKNVNRLLKNQTYETLQQILQEIQKEKFLSKTD